jgi:hypothetical protein
VVDEVSKLKQELDGEIVVLGSPQLARTLIDRDLVDELRLMIYPVVLGAGARLFGETRGKKPMSRSERPNGRQMAQASRTSARPLSAKRASGRTPSSGDRAHEQLAIRERGGAAGGVAAGQRDRARPGSSAEDDPLGEVDVRRPRGAALLGVASLQIATSAPRVPIASIAKRTSSARSPRVILGSWRVHRRS